MATSAKKKHLRVVIFENQVVRTRGNRNLACVISTAVLQCSNLGKNVESSWLESTDIFFPYIYSYNYTTGPMLRWNRQPSRAANIEWTKLLLWEHALRPHARFLHDCFVQQSKSVFSIVSLKCQSKPTNCRTEREDNYLRLIIGFSQYLNF